MHSTAAHVCARSSSASALLAQRYARTLRVTPTASAAAAPPRLPLHPARAAPFPRQLSTSRGSLASLRASCAARSPTPTKSTAAEEEEDMSEPSSPVPASFYDLKAPKPGSGDKVIDFADFRGKVVLIFNSATKCGFTPQLKELQALHEKYSSRGLVVLGFPSSEFGGQNPEDDAGSATFCQRNYGVDFGFAAKGHVNGKEASTVFKWLKSQKNGKGLLGINAIKWNFTKFLVDAHGEVVERYSPQTAPSAIEPAIEKALKDVPAPGTGTGAGSAAL